MARPWRGRCRSALSVVVRAPRLTCHNRSPSSAPDRPRRPSKQAMRVRFPSPAPQLPHGIGAPRDGGQTRDLRAISARKLYRGEAPSCLRGVPRTPALTTRRWATRPVSNTRRPNRGTCIVACRSALISDGIDFTDIWIGLGLAGVQLAARGDDARMVPDPVGRRSGSVN